MYITAHTRIATKTSLHCERLFTNEYLNLDFICVKCHINSEIVIIHCLYIPPNSPLNLYQSHLNVIKSITRESNLKIIVLVDFNLPGIEWILSESNEYFIPINVRSAEAVLTCDSFIRNGFF